MKLVDDLSLIWKRWSIQIVAAQAVILGVYGALAVVDLQPDVPGWLKWTSMMVFTLAALAAAPLTQKNLAK